jgi:hypothetical protein
MMVTIFIIVTCRPTARERVGTHVAVEMDSWKPTHYGAMFPWIRVQVINIHFCGYGNERCFLSVSSDDI